MPTPNVVVTVGEVLCEKLPKHWAAESQWIKGVIRKVLIQVQHVHQIWEQIVKHQLGCHHV